MYVEERRASNCGLGVIIAECGFSGCGFWTCSCRDKSDCEMCASEFESDFCMGSVGAEIHCCMDVVGIGGSRNTCFPNVMRGRSLGIFLICEMRWFSEFELADCAKLFVSV